MFWQEDDETTTAQNQLPMLDLGFAIRCQQLPRDHATALAAAILDVLPWLEQESAAGIHTIRGAVSGNGWNCSETMVQCSRRTRLYLRLPQRRHQDALALCDQQLRVHDEILTIGQARPRPTRSLSCLHAYQVVTERGESESEFMRRIADELASQQIRVRKMLCGLTGSLETGNGSLQTDRKSVV